MTDSKRLLLSTILKTTDILPDMMMLTTSDDGLMGAHEGEEFTHVLLKTGEVVDYDFFQSRLNPYLGTQFDTLEYYTLMRFCGFTVPGELSLDEAVLMIRRMVAKVLIGQGLTVNTNRVAINIFMKIAPYTTFTDELMVVENYQLFVDRTIQFDLLTNLTNAEQYQVFRQLLENPVVELHIGEKVKVVNSQSGDTVEYDTLESLTTTVTTVMNQINLSEEDLPES